MDQKQSLDQFKGQNRLPRFAVPNLYDLHLKIDLDSCTFSGVLQISLSIVEETRFLVLNSLELGIDQVYFTSNSAHQVFDVSSMIYVGNCLDFCSSWVLSEVCFSSNFDCGRFALVRLFRTMKMRYWYCVLMEFFLLVKEYSGSDSLGFSIISWRVSIDGALCNLMLLAKIEIFDVYSFTLYQLNGDWIIFFVSCQL